MLPCAYVIFITLLSKRTVQHYRKLTIKMGDFVLTKIIYIKVYRIIWCTCTCEIIPMVKVINISSLHIINFVCVWVLNEPEISLSKFLIFNIVLLMIVIRLYLRSLNLLLQHNCSFGHFDQHFHSNWEILIFSSFKVKHEIKYDEKDINIIIYNKHLIEKYLIKYSLPMFLEYLLSYLTNSYIFVRYL